MDNDIFYMKVKTVYIYTIDQYSIYSPTSQFECIHSQTYLHCFDNDNREVRKEIRSQDVNKAIIEFIKRGVSVKFTAPPTQSDFWIKPIYDDDNRPWEAMQYYLIQGVKGDEAATIEFLDELVREWSAYSPKEQIALGEKLAMTF